MATTNQMNDHVAGDHSSNLPPSVPAITCGLLTSTPVTTPARTDAILNPFPRPGKPDTLRAGSAQVGVGNATDREYLARDAGDGGRRVRDGAESTGDF